MDKNSSPTGCTPCLEANSSSSRSSSRAVAEEDAPNTPPCSSRQARRFEKDRRGSEITPLKVKEPPSSLKGRPLPPPLPGSDELKSGAKASVICGSSLQVCSDLWFPSVPSLCLQPQEELPEMQGPEDALESASWPAAIGIGEVECAAAMEMAWAAAGQYVQSLDWMQQKAWDPKGCDLQLTPPPGLGIEDLQANWDAHASAWLGTSPTTTQEETAGQVVPAQGTSISESVGEGGQPSETDGAVATAANQARAGQGARHDRIIGLMREALQRNTWTDREGKEETTDPEGYVQLTRLLKNVPDLQRETFSSVKFALQVIEGQNIKAIRLERGRRRVRLASIEELIIEEAEKRLPHQSGSSGQKIAEGPTRIALEEIVAALRPYCAGEEDCSAAARSALRKKDSAFILTEEDEVLRRPRVSQLQRIVEELFSDQHLTNDARLRGKIMDSVNGEVPLTWLCSRYAPKLGTDKALAGQDAEAAAEDLCKALRESQVLVVDKPRLTVKRRQRFEPEANAAWQPAARDEKKSVSSARCCSQLKNLLDFYFEPFTLQHNRYLRDLVARQLGPPEEAGPWRQGELGRFSFSFEDLRGLGRIASALDKIRGGIKEASEASCWEQLRHLVRRGDGCFQLRSPPEVRSFVGASGVEAEQVKAVTRYMTAAREERGHPVTGVVTVLSYSVREALQDKSSDAQQRHARLKRQLLVYRTDVVCLQGLDLACAGGAALASALTEEGYCAKHSTSLSTQISIFWERSSWELVASEERGAALVVDLRSFEDKRKVISFVCMCPSVQDLVKCESALPSMEIDLDEAEGRRIVCADLGQLGGVEGRELIDQLAGLDSVMEEVLGAELEAPCVCKAGTEVKSACRPLRSGRRVDAMLFEGLEPVAALSGHTVGYLMEKRTEDEMAAQFPAFRLPLVAAFDWRSPTPCRRSLYNDELAKSNLIRI